MTALEQRQDFALNQYAKGLLKPFKGKGEILRFRDELDAECRRMWQEAADFANRYNRTVVQAGLWLKPHNNSGGRVRAVQWRDKAQTWQLAHALGQQADAQGGGDALVDLIVDFASLYTSLILLILI